MSGHAFISYSRTDLAYVRKLEARFTELGISLWYDYSLLAGDRFDDEIARQIRDCSAFLVVLSPRSVASEWVRREIAYADELHKPMLPLLLEPFDSEAAPIRLAQMQREDVVGARLPSVEFIQRLQALTRTPAPKPSAQSRLAPDAPPRGVSDSALTTPNSSQLLEVTRSGKDQPANTPPDLAEPTPLYGVTSRAVRSARSRSLPLRKGRTGSRVLASVPTEPVGLRRTLLQRMSRGRVWVAIAFAATLAIGGTAFYNAKPWRTIWEVTMPSEIGTLYPGDPGDDMLHDFHEVLPGYDHLATFYDLVSSTYRDVEAEDRPVRVQAGPRVGYRCSDTYGPQPSCNLDSAAIVKAILEKFRLRHGEILGTLPLDEHTVEPAPAGSWAAASCTSQTSRLDDRTAEQLVYCAWVDEAFYGAAAFFNRSLASSEELLRMIAPTVSGCAMTWWRKTCWP